MNTGLRTPARTVVMDPGFPRIGAPRGACAAGPPSRAPDDRSVVPKSSLVAPRNLTIPPHAALLRLAEQAQQLAQALPRRLAGGVEDEIRLGVERLAASQDRDEIVHRPIVIGHRAQIALLGDAAHMLFRSGFEPDRPARRRQQLEG